MTNADIENAMDDCRSGLDASNNPFNEWGLDAFEGADFSGFERTDLINAIKHLVALGYWWKLAASLPDGVPEARHYKEKLRAG